MGMANTISDLSFSPVLSGPNNSAIVRAKKRCFLEEILYSRFYPLRSSLLRRRTINIARNHLFPMSFSIYIYLYHLRRMDEIILWEDSQVFREIGRTAIDRSRKWNLYRCRYARKSYNEVEVGRQLRYSGEERKVYPTDRETPPYLSTHANYVSSIHLTA